MPELMEVTPEGRLRIRFHRGQWHVWESPGRFILALAGWQSGKTVVGPPWLYREIQRQGPGDYLVASPTYPLMQKKVLPEFLRLFERLLRLGKFVGGARNCFTFSDDGCKRTFGRVPLDPVQIFFGHAGDPNSLESATIKAAWLDEAGQKGFRLASWEAILGRLSIHQGRVLLTSRPYDLGWLKQQVWDRWKAGDLAYDVINFRSIDNPAFPRAEYERARSTLPGWKFRMAYDGIFERPAGIIYDVFDDAVHKVPRFVVPRDWPRHLGLDFGGVNTAGVFLAEEVRKGLPSRFYAYREYRAGGRTAAEHKEALLLGEPGLPNCTGGSKSEGQWRAEFGAAGLYVREPAVTGVGSVEVGINRVYGLFKTGRLFIMSDLHGLLDEVQSYSRVLDDAGEPTEEIEQKDTYHLLDALRYIGTHIASTEGEWADLPLDRGKDRDLVAQAPRGVWPAARLEDDEEEEQDRWR